MLRISLLLAVVIISCSSREIPIVKFRKSDSTGSEEETIFKFEALFKAENARKLVISGEQQDYVDSPTITSYNEPTTLQWFLRLYPNTRERMGYSSEKTFEVVPYIKTIPFGVKTVKVKIEFAIQQRDKSLIKEEIRGPHDIHVASREPVQFKGGLYKHYWSSLEVDPDAIPSSDPDLIIHFKAEATYTYEKVNLLQFPPLSADKSGEFARETIEELDLLKNETVTSDMTLKSGGKEMKCHKSVLARRSPIFKNHFSTFPLKDALDLSEEINGEELENMVRFLYTGRAANLVGTCYKLYPLAIKYGMIELEGQCEQVLVKLIDSGNATEWFWYGQQHGSTEILRKAACKVASMC